MYQGDWVNNVEGTRQINSVTSGERGPGKLVNVGYHNLIFSKHYIKTVLSRFVWWHKIKGSDCLLKTQDSAKLQNDV